MNVEQIQEQENISNAAFKKWMKSRQFHLVQNSLKEELIIYVSALLHEISDFKADSVRLQSECDSLKVALKASILSADCYCIAVTGKKDAELDKYREQVK